MARAILAALAVACLLATNALAATKPSWTASGTVKALNSHEITVGHETCRITAASPARAVLRLYYVGVGVKIACVSGVLRTIDVLSAKPSIVSDGVPKCTGSTGNFTANAAVSLSESNACSVISDTLAGTFAVTRLSSSSLTAGAGSITLTCALGAGSPDTSTITVGSQLTRLTCRGGVLTGFAGS
jgi:hypothetical protein